MSKQDRRERDFDKRLEQAKRDKELFDRELEIHQIRKSMRRWNPPTTTKLLMAFILINCTVVEVYSMVVMYLLMDLSALYSLITAVITESLSFAVYAAKSYNETKQEEIIKLEREKQKDLVEIERAKLASDTSSPDEEGMDESADPDNELGGDEY